MRHYVDGPSRSRHNPGSSTPRNSARQSTTSWRVFPEDGMKQSAELDEIRLATRTEHPLANEEFDRKLE